VSETSGFPFSHGSPGRMEINMIILGTGMGMEIVTWRWEVMGIGKCDKIPERAQQF